MPQFGFDGSNIWITRRDTLFASLHANPKAKFITRGVQFGSEPLYDNVLPHQELAEQVILAKANLSSLNIPVTVSELAYGYQERGGAQDVLDAIDFINIHMLPFFDQDASTGAFRLAPLTRFVLKLAVSSFQRTPHGPLLSTRISIGSYSMETGRRCTGMRCASLASGRLKLMTTTEWLAFGHLPKCTAQQSVRSSQHTKRTRMPLSRLTIDVGLILNFRRRTSSCLTQNAST